MTLRIRDFRTAMSRRAFLAGSGIMCAAAALNATGCQLMSGPKRGSAEAPYDVAIVGSGAAGMSAALAACEAGAESVVIFEKQSTLGGNSLFASEGINAAGTEYQAASGVEDDAVAFAHDTFEGGLQMGSMDLIDAMCAGSADAISWLAGRDIACDSVSLVAGASAPRLHARSDGKAIGAVLMPALKAALDDAGADIRTSCSVVSLSGGSTSSPWTLEVDAGDGGDSAVCAFTVVLAAGGLCSNAELVGKYRPDLAEFVSTNVSAATGDGYALAETLGCKLVQMEQIQVQPTVAATWDDEARPRPVIAELLRLCGAILVSGRAARFIDELSARDQVALAITDQARSGSVWLVFDDAVRDACPQVAAAYDPAGIVVTGQTWQELAQAIDVDGETLQATIDSWNAVCDGTVDEFGRDQGVMPLRRGACYAIEVLPGVHCEMGGVSMNTQAQALDSAGNPLPGLWAAGEVTGGVHGGNRIGGNGLTDAVVFGRIAGVGAVATARTMKESRGNAS